MMGHDDLSPAMLVDDLLSQFPDLARLFVEMRLGCMGCPMSRFCTLEDVSVHYSLEVEAFLAEAEARARLGENRTNSHG